MRSGENFTSFWSRTAPRLARASAKRPWRWRTMERLIALAAMPSALRKAQRLAVAARRVLELAVAHVVLAFAVRLDRGFLPRGGIVCRRLCAPRSREHYREEQNRFLHRFPNDSKLSTGSVRICDGST